MIRSVSGPPISERDSRDFQEKRFSKSPRGVLRLRVRLAHLRGPRWRFVGGRGREGQGCLGTLSESLDVLRDGGSGKDYRILENIPDPSPDPTGSCFDPAQNKGSGIFHQIPDPNRIPPDPFLTTLWGGPD